MIDNGVVVTVMFWGAVLGYVTYGAYIAVLEIWLNPVLVRNLRGEGGVIWRTCAAVVVLLLCMFLSPFVVYNMARRAAESKETKP